MNNTFASKVAVERSVLDVVNAGRSQEFQLAGLSSAAIDAWRQKIGYDATRQVAVPLMALANLSQLVSDRSHEVFCQVGVTLPNAIENQIVMLKSKISQMEI